MKSRLLLRILAFEVVALLFIGMLIPVITLHKSTSDDLPDFESHDTADVTESLIGEDLPNSTTATRSTDPINSQEITYFLELTDDEIWILATAIYLEGGGESVKCQDAICSVIMNRMITREQTLHEVLYDEDQFEVAPLIEDSMPDDIQIGLVHDRCMNGTTVPLCVTFFRAGQYHDERTVDTAYIKPYIVIDNTYFSHDIRICGGEH